MMSDYTHKGPCNACGSSDANAHYDDGHTYCFSCNTTVHAAGSTPQERVPEKQKDWTLLEGEYQDLPERRLYAKTMQKFRYQFGMTNDGTPCHIAMMCDANGLIVAQKLRLPNKEFQWRGEAKKAGLFGQELWESGGKRLVVTEGEMDALSYAQVTGLTWPVVSVPNGAQGAAKSIRKSLEFIESFDEVVFLFDNDEHGIAAAHECAELLTPSKAKIATLPLKDASDMLKAGRDGELKQAVYNAKTCRPDGIFAGGDLNLADLQTAVAAGYSIPFKGLNDSLHGLRKRELVTVTAGSGIGKTTLVREMAYHLTVEHGLRVGYIMLEESLQKSAQSLIALHNGVPVGDLAENPALITQDNWQEGFTKAVQPAVFYDAWGSTSVDNIISKMRYLAIGEQCDFIVLDHISMVVSALDGDERKTIDQLMTRIRSEVCEQTGAGVLAITHLRRNGNKDSFNEGGQVSATDLRGSAAIEQLSDVLIAAERNQQAEEGSCNTHLRLLKNRPFGVVGSAGYANYNVQTGRLLHAEAPEASTVTDAAEAFSF